MAHEEYLRRNLLVAKAYGAASIADSAIAKLSAQKRPAKWLLEALKGISDRVNALPEDMAAWRNTADDAPEWIRPRAEATEGAPK